MRLIGHIVKKDFQRMWVPLGLWALILLAQGRVGSLALAHDGINLDRWTMLAIANGVVLGLDILVNVILVAVLVHEDTLVGTRMWWATRPIGGGQLLAAKSISAVLMFGALPVLAALPWWLANDYGGADLLRAAVARLDQQALVVLPALALAVLTETPLKFLGWLLVLAAVAGVLPLTAQMFFPTDSRLGPVEAVVWTRFVVAAGLIVAGLVSTIVCQFLTRWLARTLTILAGIAGLVTVVAVGWRWSFLSSELKSSSGTEAVTLTPAKIRLHPPQDTDQSVTMDGWLRGVPDELAVRGYTENVWRWGNGETGVNLASLRTGWPAMAEWRALGLPPGKDSGVYNTWRRSGQEQPEEWESADGHRVRTEIYLTTDDVAQLRGAPPAYTGTWVAKLQRPEREFELPLRRGERLAGPDGSVRVAVVEWREGELSVTVITSESGRDNYGAFRPGLFSIFEEYLAGSSRHPRSFALVNRARGEAVKLWEAGRTVGFPVGSERIAWLTFKCHVPRDADEPPGRPPRWLDGATLASLRGRDAGQVVREVKLEPFTMVDVKEQPR